MKKYMNTMIYEKKPYLKFSKKTNTVSKNLYTAFVICSLQCRHNGRDGDSNHQRLGYLLNYLSCSDQRKYRSSASLAF